MALHDVMERRRRAMLDAARSLLESEPLSMRRLADVAGVSPATPYNLFGSKRRILLELYQDLNDDLLAEILASDARDALDRLYEAFRLMARNLAAAPGMYRALIAGLYSGGDELGLSDPAIKVWTELFAALRDEAFLDDDVDFEAFTANFIFLLSGALLAWTEAQIDGPALEQAVRYGFTLSTLAAAPAAHHDRLKRVLQARPNRLEGQTPRAKRTSP